MANKKTQRDSLSSWILPIFLLMVFPPVGILLLVLKVLDDAKKPRKRHPYYSQTNAQAPAGARTTRGTAPSEATVSAKAKPSRSKKAKDPAAELAAKGKRLTLIGTILLLVASFVLLTAIGDSFYWILNSEWAWFVEDILDSLPLFCFWCGGLGCLLAGRRKTKKASRYRSYLAMIGRQTTISISALASATGRSPSKVRDDLTDMLDDGLFPKGFLDYGGDRLVLTGDGLSHEQPSAPKAAAAPDPEASLLSDIRAVNEAIENPKLSAQIDRIGVITAQILEYQKNHPEKSPQLHSFLSYYLPTTLKILRAYGQLERQPVSGDNITAAMQRIEGMMDKVVDGFEKQLDLLYRDDAMDITTDVEVLERMLAKDGLSGQSITLNL